MITSFWILKKSAFHFLIAPLCGTLQANINQEWGGMFKSQYF